MLKNRREQPARVVRYSEDGQQAGAGERGGLELIWTTLGVVAGRKASETEGGV